MSGLTRAPLRWRRDARGLGRRTELLGRRLTDTGIAQGLSCLLDVGVGIRLHLAVARGERRAVALRHSHVLMRRLASLIVLDQRA